MANLTDRADFEFRRFVVWQDEDAWLGYWEDHPSCWTQGETLDDVKLQLDDLLADLTDGALPGI